MKNKTGFTKLIQLGGILFLLGIGISIITTDAAVSYHYFNARVARKRSDYIAGQKQKIKHEVDHVIARINREKSESTTLTKQKVRSRVYEAYSIASNVYEQNKASVGSPDIKKMIRDALSPIRFEDGCGYYFILGPAGQEILSVDEDRILTGRKQQHLDAINDLIEIARQSGEGFYEYGWMKPDSAEQKCRKISFIKRFEPFDWIIGTGLYVDDVENQIKKELLESIGGVRFGENNEGYIFVVTYGGTTLMNDTQRYLIGKNIWQLTDSDGVKVIQEERKAVENPEGDFVYYSWKKPSTGEVTKKVSFMRGIKDWEWIVGAGMYLDDVEADIAAIQKDLNSQIRAKILFFSLIALCIVTFFVLLFGWLNRMLRHDFDLFVSFFNKAVFSDEPIDRQLVHFAELDQMAANANRMLEDKTRARQGLRDERERLFTTIHSISDGIIATDVSGRVELMNMVAEQLTGWTIDEAQGKHLKDIFTIVNARTCKDVENPVDRVLKSGTIVGLANHTMLISRDGAHYQIADSAAPIKDSDGSITGVVLVFRDETQQYRMREELWKSEENLRTVFQAARNVAFVKTDMNGKDAKILEFSPGAEQIFGYKKEEIIGKPVAVLHIPEDVEKLPEVFRNMSGNKDGFSGEFTLVRKSGEKFPALFTTYPIFDNDGAMVAAIGVSSDITELKRAQEELRKMERLSSIGTLAGGIAHDFNNILMGLYGNISLCKEFLSHDHPGYRTLDEAEKSMNRAIRLTKQLLTFAKGGAPVMESITLDTLVEEVIRFDLSGSSVKPVFKKSEDLWPVQADKGQIQQVFSNLTINARQAMHDGGHLYITLENADVRENMVPGLDQGRYVRITVTDEGTGIEAKYLDRIFDPYFSTKQAGNGLGLATAYAVINKHGGRISVDTQLGVGTTFTLYLPAAESMPTEKRQPVRACPDKAQTSRILVMDDEDMICRLVCQMLGGAGFTVEMAPGGREAIDLYKQALDARMPFDAVIMDLTIPGGIGGKDAVKGILKIDPKARVIVSSGYADDPVMACYSEYGFKGVVTKPYTKARLLEVLSQVLTAE